MKKTILVWIMIYSFPFLSISQEKQIVWEAYTPKQIGCIIPKNHTKTIFYNDNTFESITLIPPIIGGKGSYKVSNSVITCNYNGKTPNCYDIEKGYVELIPPIKASDNFKIIVKGYAGDELPGAIITLKSDQNKIIDQLSTNFDGVAIIPNKKFNKIIVEYVGYNRIEATFENVNTHLKVVLGNLCPDLIIAKGSKKKFKIIESEKKSLTLKLLSFNKVLYH